MTAKTAREKRRKDGCIYCSNPIHYNIHYSSMLTCYPE
jgi:hypothetical protein